MNVPDGSHLTSAGRVPGGVVTAGPAGEPGRRRWLVLAVVGLAQLMIVLDITIMNIALPSAQAALGFSDPDRQRWASPTPTGSAGLLRPRPAALGFSDADQQWVITGYALAFGSLLLFGRKVTFLAGLAGFAVASAVGGASTSFTMLITARACQGAFAALLAPAALGLLTATFSGARAAARGRRGHRLVHAAVDEHRNLRRGNG